MSLTRRQKRMCRREPGLAETLRESVRLGQLECRYQFRNERWNCTLDGRGSLLKRGERAFWFWFLLLQLQLTLSQRYEMGCCWFRTKFVWVCLCVCGCVWLCVKSGWWLFSKQKVIYKNKQKHWVNLPSAAALQKHIIKLACLLTLIKSKLVVFISACSHKPHMMFPLLEFYIKSCEIQC